MWENVAICVRPWMIVMFQKKELKKKWTNCNEIPLFVMWEKVKIFWGGVGGQLMHFVGLRILQDLSQNINKYFSGIYK